MTGNPYPYEFMVDDLTAEFSYNQTGEAVLGYLHISDDRRYKATRYNAKQYQIRCQANKKTSLNCFLHSYHSSKDLTSRGTEEDRHRFWLDLHKFVVMLPYDEYVPVLEMLKNGKDCNSLTGESRELALGLRYSEADLDHNKGSLARYMRGFYFQAAHSDAGIIIGKLGSKEPPSRSRVTSTTSSPILDRHTAANFGETKTPDDDLRRQQRGQLVLPFETDDESTPLWTLPTNDSWVLGAIHFGRDVHLASSRAPSSIFRNGIGGQLSVFGREVAVVFNSDAYELHCSRVLGETFAFVGAPKGGSYNVTEMMQGINRVVSDQALRSAITWMHSAKDNINPSDVIVISLETVCVSKTVQNVQHAAEVERAMYMSAQNDRTTTEFRGELLTKEMLY
jgi:hypothetical protein